MDGLFLLEGGKKEIMNDNSRLCCCMICFVFIFIILIIAICWTNYDTFENFGNIVGCNQETLKNVLSGGFHYVSLNPNDNIIKKLNELKKKNQAALVAVLAPWCGYCKQLKQSGVLKEIAKKYPVLVIDDKHPQTRDIMHILQAEGFPALGIFGKGELKPYNGPRQELSIIQTLNAVQGETKMVENFKNKGQVIKVPPNVTPDMLMEQIKINHSKGHKVCTIFMADWCGYCKKLKNSGMLDKLADSGVIVYAIDENNQMTKKMNVSGFPTIICWKGTKYKKYEGQRTHMDVLDFIKKM